MGVMQNSGPVSGPSKCQDHLKINLVTGIKCYVKVGYSATSIYDTCGQDIARRRPVRIFRNRTIEYTMLITGSLTENHYHRYQPSYPRATAEDNGKRHAF